MFGERWSEEIHPSIFRVFPDMEEQIQTKLAVTSHLQAHDDNIPLLWNVGFDFHLVLNWSIRRFHTLSYFSHKGS